jgi:putative ABC transport system substrate-binding protein
VRAANAQSKRYRIGILETRNADVNAANLKAFREGLRELGYKEGYNLELVYRSAHGRADRYPELAAERIRLRADLILTRGTPASIALKNATSTIPVVMAATGDPVGTGLARSLAHPAGNLTGISANDTEIVVKRVDLLRELLPGLKRIAGLFNMGNPVAIGQWKRVEKACATDGIQTLLLDLRHADEFWHARTASSTHDVKGGDRATTVDTRFDSRTTYCGCSPALRATSPQRWCSSFTICCASSMVEDAG